MTLLRNLLIVDKQLIIFSIFAKIVTMKEVTVKNSGSTFTPTELADFLP